MSEWGPIAAEWHELWGTFAEPVLGATILAALIWNQLPAGLAKRAGLGLGGRDGQDRN